jgi:DNA-binding response OmpR family regulator
MPTKILVADDDPAILDCLQMFLTAEGYQVDCLADAAQITTNYSRSNLPDLILLDIWMSGSSGKEVCLRLKKHRLFKKVPILLVSAHQDTAKIAQEIGADGYLLKPFDINELRSLVKKFDKS